MRGGGQRPFGIFPKNHLIWYWDPSLISTNNKKFIIVKMDLIPDDNEKCTSRTVKNPFATKEKAYQTLHINIKLGGQEGLPPLFQLFPNPSKNLNSLRIKLVLVYSSILDLGKGAKRGAFFVLKTPKNAMKHMILSFQMKGDVRSDHFLILWFQKDSLDMVGFRTYGGGSRV